MKYPKPRYKFASLQTAYLVHSIITAIVIALLVNLCKYLMGRLTMSSQTRLNEDGEIEKHCPGCGEWWYADHEFFHYNKNNPDGLATYCHACQSEKRLATYYRHKELRICPT